MEDCVKKEQKNEREASPAAARFLEVSVKVEEDFVNEEPEGVKQELAWEGEVVRLTVEPEFLTDDLCVKEESEQSERAGSCDTEITNSQDIFDETLQDTRTYATVRSESFTQRCNVEQVQQQLRTSSEKKPELNQESIAVGEKLYDNQPLNTATLLNPQKARRKPWTCDICSKSYTRKDHLKTHQLIHVPKDGSTPKPFTCEICKKNFPKMSSLKVHERLHTGQKPYRCEICQREFTQLGHLNTHRLVHTGQKPYSCDICKKEFSQSSNLNAHKLTHEEIQNRTKPYACEICENKFTKLSNLKRHAVLHTGQKLYACDICNKEFAQSSNLNVHKLIHSGEKRHACDICHKKFLLKSTQTAHRRIHTGERPYLCEICNKNYTRLSDLNVHKRIHSRI